jgi:hypothetical protein
MSVIQIEPGKCPATHKLDGISWRHVSDSNRAWEVPSNSQAGWDFIRHVSDSNRAWEVPSNSHPGWDFIRGMSVIQIETGKCPATHSWMGFHEGMSVIQIETRKCPATHKLDGISWRHVSDSNRAWEVPSNSHPGWDFMEACQ